MTTIKMGDEIRLASRRTAVLAAFLANGLGIGAWAAALPMLKSGLGLSDGQLGLALFGFAAGAVVSMPLTGAYAPRHGSGRATWIAGLAFAFALVLPRLAGELAGLAASAFLLGAANGALDVSMNARASEVEAEFGRPIMSSFHAAFSLGGLAGAALGGFLVAFDPGSVLWMPAAIAMILVLGFAPDLGRGERVVAPTQAPRVVLPGRAALGLCLVAFVCMMIEGATADWSAVYIASVNLGPVAPAAAGYAVFSLAMTCCRLWGDRLVGRLGPARVARIGGTAAVVGLAIAALLPGWGAVVGFGLVGLGLANVVPVVFSAAGRLGSSAAVGVAMVATAGYAGFLAGPPIIGAVASLLSLRAGIVVLALLAPVVALLSNATIGRR